MQSTEKVIVIGDGVCGKTSRVAKITERKLINNYQEVRWPQNARIMMHASCLNSSHTNELKYGVKR